MRTGIPADLPALLVLRGDAGTDALSDPALIDADRLRGLIAAGMVMVWDEDSRVAGFAAVDAAVIHLLVDPGTRGKGVGRELLAWACDGVRAAGHAAASLSLAAGSTAARHYRAAGWQEAGTSPTGGAVLKKPF